jgi:hypothetical protein
LQESRKVLQEIGASFANDPDELCRALLAHAAWKPGTNLIVDGIRHAAIMNALRRITKLSDVYLVFVRVDDAERMRRIAMHDMTMKSEMSDYDSHSTEADAEHLLPSMANVIIDGTLPISENVLRIMKWLQEEVSAHQS